MPASTECSHVLFLSREMNYSTASASAAPYSYLCTVGVVCSSCGADWQKCKCDFMIKDFHLWAVLGMHWFHDGAVNFAFEIFVFKRKPTDFFFNSTVHSSILQNCCKFAEIELLIHKLINCNRPGNLSCLFLLRKFCLGLQFTPVFHTVGTVKRWLMSS